MPGVVSQALAAGQPAPGFPVVPLPGALGVQNMGLVSASFSAQRNSSYIVPVGGTVIFPSPTGSGAFIVLTLRGQGLTTVSGTQSVNGVVVTSFPYQGGQTIIFCDAGTVAGWT